MECATHLHELGDVATVDVRLEDLGVELLGLGVKAREAALGVGHKDAAVRRALHGTEDTGTGRGARDADVEEGLERAGLALDRLGELELARGLGDALVLVGEAELGEGTARDEEAGRVARSPVGEAVLDAVARELVRVGGGEDDVTLELGRDDLRVWESAQAERESVQCAGKGKNERERAGRTWQMTSRLVMRTTKRYFGLAYLFFAWTTRRLRAAGVTRGSKVRSRAAGEGRGGRGEGGRTVVVGLALTTAAVLDLETGEVRVVLLGLLQRGSPRPGQRAVLVKAGEGRGTRRTTKGMLWRRKRWWRVGQSRRRDRGGQAQ